MTWASSEAFLSENHPSFPIQETGKIYEIRRKFHENRSYEKAEDHGALFQRKRSPGGSLHPRYEAETAAAGIRRKNPQLCQLTEDDEQGGLRFEIAKERISIRLTAPYSEERKSNARKWAKENGLRGKYDGQKRENAETGNDAGETLRN